MLNQKLHQVPLQKLHNQVSASEADSTNKPNAEGLSTSGAHHISIDESESNSKARLPQTGLKENNQSLGMFGLLLASIGSLLGLAGASKRRKDKDQ